MTGLLMVGIVVTDVAAVTALRSYLLDQIDEDLVEARGPATRRLNFDGRRDPGLSEYFLEVRDSDGDVITRIAPGLRDAPTPGPSMLATDVLANAGGRPFTVQSAPSGERYRAVVGVSQDRSYLVTVATPLDDVDRAVDRLIFVELVVTSVLLLFLVAAGYIVIRREFQPLEDMVDTAGAIAGGDLSRRVERADEVTEVGRLGSALNNMLMQIESSFSRTKASEDRLRRFAADASHELRTPLTAIRGYAEMYRAGAVQDDEHMARVMSRIEHESRRMGSLVEDLLTLARLDQGRPMEMTTVDIAEVVRNVAHDAQAADESHPVNVSIPDGPVFVEGDAARLHQTIANLASNAQVHTEAGVRIDLAVVVEGDEAVITVADNGAGIDPEALSRIFERFYRADSGRARSDGGTGLGLSIVQALVEAHRGSVKVRSTVGAGTTFEVRLPLAT